MIHPSLVALAEFVARPFEVNDCVVQKEDVAVGVPLEAGTEVGRVLVVSTGPNPDVKMHVGLITYPQFRNGIAVMKFFADVGSFITKLISSFDPDIQSLAETFPLDWYFRETTDVDMTPP